jgi:hypothetical protein
MLNFNKKITDLTQFCKVTCSFLVKFWMKHKMLEGCLKRYLNAKEVSECKFKDASWKKIGERIPTLWLGSVPTFGKEPIDCR